MIHLNPHRPDEPKKFLVNDPAELPLGASGCQTLFLDFETWSGDRRQGGLNPWAGHRICGAALTWDEHPHSYYVPVRHNGLGPHNMEVPTFQRWLHDVVGGCIAWANHNVGRFDAHFARADGAEFRGELHDTLVYSKLIESDRGFSGDGYGLDALSSDWLGEDIDLHDQAVQAHLLGMRPKSKDYADVPSDLMGAYACQDVVTNRKLYRHCLAERDRIVSTQCERFGTIWEIETRLTPVLYDIEERGLRVDPMELRVKQFQILRELIELQEEIHQRTGYPAEPSNSGDCAELLLNKYGLPVLGWTDKSNPSFDKETLKAYLRHPTVLQSEEMTWVVSKLLHYRKRHTQLTFFVDPYLKRQVDGVLHPSYNQLVRTGRLSSSGPNAQQLDKEAKALVHPTPGMSFVSTDAASVEFRLICLPADEPIITEHGVKPMGWVVENKPRVLSCNGIALQFSRVTASWSIGVQPVLKVTLEDGTIIRCTHDHGFMRKKCDWFLDERINARDLRVGDSLEHVHEDESGAYPKWEVNGHIFCKHRLNLIKESITSEIHHKDEDKRNWHIDNLEELSAFDHKSLHNRLRWERLTPEERETLSNARREYIKKGREAFAEKHPSWTKECERCGADIRVTECSSYVKYCSQECYRKSKKGRGPEKPCEMCGTVMKLHPKSVRKFCCQDCYTRHKRGEPSLYAPVSGSDNHRVVSVEPDGEVECFQITVDDWHTYVHECGLVSFNCHYSQDRVALDAYAKDPDADFHALVATMCGIKRRPAKTVNFCVAYGGGKERVLSLLSQDMELVGGMLDVAKQLVAEGRVHPDQQNAAFEALCRKRAEDVYRQYHSSFPGIKRITRQAALLMKTTGYAFNEYGRVRRLPERAAFRTLNSITQGLASDIIKYGMIQLAPRYNSWSRSVGLEMAANVHDEVLMELPNPVAHDQGVLSKIVTTLETLRYPLRVPIRFGCGVSDRDWREAGSDDAMVRVDRSLAKEEAA
jgi:DNA polymerase I-like protein with 3'-5' exonuclease and polymerase domains